MLIFFIFINNKLEDIIGKNICFIIIIKKIKFIGMSLIKNVRIMWRKF